MQPVLCVRKKGYFLGSERTTNIRKMKTPAEDDAREGKKKRVYPLYSVSAMFVPSLIRDSFKSGF